MSLRFVRIGSVVQLAQDARFAARSIRRNWRFALAFVVPLALGIGAGATFYSIIDHVLYRPPPQVADAGGIVRVAITTPDVPDPFAAGNDGVAWIDLDALVRHSTTLESVAGYLPYRASLGRGENARTIPAILATASYFTVLGVRPQLGRFYAAEEDAQTSSSVPCVAGDHFWRTELGASPTLGQVLQVGSLRCTIVGVTPPGFNGVGVTPNELWVPLRAGGEASQGGAALWNTDGSHWLQLIARRKRGVALAAISQDASRAYRAVTIVRHRDPKIAGGMAATRLMGSTVTSSKGRVKLAWWLVGGAIALVLLVGANIVNLLVARNLSRLRETAIRLALGGGRARLFRHYLLECAGLSALAGLGSLLVVRWVGPIVRSALYPGTTWADGPVTGRIIVLAMGLSLFAGSVVSAITAGYAVGVDPAALFAAGGSTRASGTRRTHRVRMALVGMQAAFSVVLLLASGGFVRSFRAAATSSLGFDIRGIVFAEVPGLYAVDSSEAGRREFYEDLHQRLKAVPGVTGVSLGYMAPWLYNRTEAMRIPGRDSLPIIPGFGEPAYDAVTPDYLETMHLTLRAGRWISGADGPGAAPVMVVSEALARLYWPGRTNVLGECIQIGTSPACHTIVGVVQDVRFSGSIDSPLIASYYIPVAQATQRPVLKLFIRVRGNPGAAMATIRRLVQAARPALPAADVHLMQDQLDPRLASWRLGAIAFTALGIVAAVVALLGLFSVMAYLVAERGREFAIRSALGARATQIVGPLLKQGLLIVGTGSAVGVVVAWYAEQWLQPLLFQVQLLDVRVVNVVIGGLLLAACAAAFGPARRASVTDPIDALRAD